jgi:hypothetical protein
MSNPGPVAGTERLRPLIARASAEAKTAMASVFGVAEKAIRERVEKWSQRTADWTHEADVLIQRKELDQRRISIRKEEEMAAAMAPERQLVRPLLLVMPADQPVASHLDAKAGEE